MKDVWDAVVAGGGFAGSITAAGLARLGMCVLVLDRRIHPRFTVGESSTPLASLLLARIGTRYGMDELLPFTGYGRWRRERPDVMRGCKQGFVYLHRADDGEVGRLMVAASRTREVADTQWLRSDFDHALFEIARTHGVEIAAPVHVLAWTWAEDARVWRLRLSEGGVEREIACTLLVDAAGLGPTEVPPHWRTRTRAAFAHFEGLPRAGDVLEGLGVDRTCEPFDIDDAVIHVLTDRGWVWLIRFDDGRVSVGFVEPRPETHRPGGLDNKNIGERLAEILPVDPLVQGCTEGGRQITPTGRIDRVQWRRPNTLGPMFARLPNAFGFIDPLHSTGNAHALAGVLRVLEAVRSDEPIQASLDRHHAMTMCELDHVDRLVGCGYPFMDDLARFEPWSMLYFAAVTCCEQSIRSGRSDGIDEGFALAGDATFAPLVSGAVAEEELRGASAARLHDKLGARFAAWNRAGLWDPARRGIYPFIELPPNAGAPEVRLAAPEPTCPIDSTRSSARR